MTITRRAGFGWCKFILYAISTLIAFYLAYSYAPISAGLNDAIWAALIFFGALFLLWWVSSRFCGLFAPRMPREGKELSAISPNVGVTPAQNAKRTAPAKGNGKDKPVDGKSGIKEKSAAKAIAKSDTKSAGESADTKGSSVKSASLTSTARTKSAESSASQAAPSPAAPPSATKKDERVDARDAGGQASDDAASTSRIGTSQTNASEGHLDTDHFFAEGYFERRARQAAAAKEEEGAANESAARASAGLLSAPKGGKADDLKLINGIGPKLEKLCNDLGVWHFDQIAAWSTSDIKFVDSKLEGFSGRIKRDKWVAQAKKLAKG